VGDLVPWTTDLVFWRGCGKRPSVAGIARIQVLVGSPERAGAAV
jgi:hypothetical protein